MGIIVVIGCMIWISYGLGLYVGNRQGSAHMKASNDYRVVNAISTHKKEVVMKDIEMNKLRDEKALLSKLVHDKDKEINKLQEKINKILA